MARVIETEFPTGYGWTEYLGTSGTVTENSSGPGTLPPNATTCLYVAKAENNTRVSAVTTFTEQAVSYFRVYIYVASEGLSNSESHDHVIQLANAIANGVIGVKLQKTAGGQLQFACNFYRSSGWLDISAANISTGTWYCVELKYDDTNDDAEWWIDGVSQGSNTSSTFGRGNAAQAHLGFVINTKPDASVATLYFAECVLENASYIGTESSTPVASGVAMATIQQIICNYQ